MRKNCFLGFLFAGHPEKKAGGKPVPPACNGLCDNVNQQELSGGKMYGCFHVERCFRQAAGLYVRSRFIIV